MYIKLWKAWNITGNPEGHGHAQSTCPSQRSFLLKKGRRKPWALISGWTCHSVEAGSEGKDRFDKSWPSVEGMLLDKDWLHFPKNQLFPHSGDLLLDSLVFHWSICLRLHWYRTILITIDLQTFLLSQRLFCCCYLGSFHFHMSLESVLSYQIIFFFKEIALKI